MQLVLTRPPRPPAIARALVFIDESGQFCRPRPDGSVERPLVAAVVFKDTDENRRRIAELGRRLRHCYRRNFKTAELSESDLESIADVVRRSGYIGWSGVEYALGEDHPDACHRAIDELRAVVDRAAPRTSLHLDVLSAIRRTRQQLDHVSRPDLAAYLVQTVYLLRRVAEWFRGEGIFPDLQVTFDEKLRPQDRDLVRFLPRLAIATVFPERFETHLSAVWSPSGENTGVISTDAECDGLLIADAVAAAQSSVQRHADPDGKYGRFLTRCYRG